MACINLTVPQFKAFAEKHGEVQLSKILENFPEDYIPTEDELNNRLTPLQRVVNYYESTAIAKRNSIIAQYGEQAVTAIVKSKDGRNRDIWAFSARIPIDEQRVAYRLRTENILLNPTDKVKQYFNGLKKGTITIEQFVDKAQIPKEQKSVVIASWNNQASLEDLAIDIAANYSFAVEINIAEVDIPPEGWTDEEYAQAQMSETRQEITTFLNEFTGEIEEIPLYVAPKPKGKKPSTVYLDLRLTVSGGINYTENEISTPLITPSIKGHAQFSTDQGIGWFRSDEQNRGTYETMNDFPLNIKGVLFRFSKEENKYFKRSGNSTLFTKVKRVEISEKEFREAHKLYTESQGKEYINNSKTRRILEVQSDLFQKGRDKTNLTKPDDFNATQGSTQNYGVFSLRGINYAKTRSGYFKNGIRINEDEYNSALIEHNSPKTYDTEKENQFLQLLNKSNNWVTFFVKSIIQDSAKKGYEKVLFPTGNTASKIENFDKIQEGLDRYNSQIKSAERLLDSKYIDSIIVEKDGGFAIPYRDSFLGGFGFNSKEKLKEYIKKQVPNDIATYKNQLDHYIAANKNVIGTINFYENTVTNILKKQGFNPTLITDEYGNTWNEVSIELGRDLAAIELQQEKVEGVENPEASKDLIRQLMDKLKNQFNLEIVEDATIPSLGMVDANGVIRINLDKATGDTAFHEVAHLFIRFLKQESPRRYAKLIKELKEVAPEIVESIKLSYADYTEARQLEEALVTLIGLDAFAQFEEGLPTGVTDKQKSLLDRILQFISEILNDLFGLEVNTIQVQSISSISDVVNMLAGENAMDLSKYQTLGTEEQQRDFSTAYHQANAVQKAMLDKLKPIIEADFKIDKDSNTYKSEKHPDKSLDRATAILNEKEFYAYEGESQDRTLSTDWGNIIDTIAEQTLNGKSFAETMQTVQNLNLEEGTINNSVAEEIRDFFLGLKEEREGSVFLTQVSPFNLEKNAGGATDIIEIDAKGKVKVIDVKSSKYSTAEDYDYEYVNKAGETITTKRNYNTPFRAGKASIKQKHEAQVSMYKALLASKGIYAESIEIIPFHISKSEGNAIAEVQAEPILNSLNEKGPTKLDEKMDILREYSKDAEYEGTQVNVGEESIRERTLHEKVKKLLQKEIQDLEREGGAYSQVRAKKLGNLQSALTGLETVRALESFIDTIYSDFVAYIDKEGDERTQTSFNIQYEIAMRKIRDTKLSPLEALHELNAVQEHIEMFYPIIEDIRQFYYSTLTNVNGVIAPGSSLYKVQKILENFDLKKSQIDAEVKPLIAKSLGVVSNQKLPDTIEPMITRLKKQLEDSINKIEKKYTIQLRTATDEQKNNLEMKKSKELHAKNEEFRQKIDNLMNFLGDEDSILKLLQTGYSGIDNFDRYMVSMIDMPNPLLSNFAKLYTRELNKNRDKLQNWGIDADKAINEIGGQITINSENVNKEYIHYSERLGRWSMISELDTDEFNEAKEAAYARIDLEDNDLKKRAELKRRWYLENTEEVPEKDVLIKNPYTNETAVLIKGRETIIREQEDIFLKEYGTRASEKYMDAMAEWKKMNMPEIDGKVSYNGYMFRHPSKARYSNPAYAQIQANPSKKAYYDFAVFSLAKAHSLYSQQRSFQSIFFLPSIHKTAVDRATQNGLKNLAKFEIKNTFGQIREEDITLYGSEEGSKRVPIMFQTKIPKDEVSLNIMSSIALYYKSALEYQTNTNIQPLASTLIRAITKDNKEHAISSNMKIIEKNAERLGLELEKYLPNFKGNATAAMLAAYIDKTIYGRNNIYEPTNFFGHTVDGGKMANLLMRLTSLSSIAAKPLVAVANYLEQNYSYAMEGVAGEYVSRESWAKAKLEYNKFFANGQLISDVVNATKKSFIGQMIDLYEPIMGQFNDHFGRELSESMAKRFINTSSLYAMMKVADHTTYTQSMIAMMMDTKISQIIDGTTKEISLYEAYEMGEDGKLKLKKGVTLPEGSRIHMEAKEKMDAMNRRLHGVYDSLNKPDIERYAAGRLLTLFRKYIVPKGKKRFKALGVDHNIGTTTEGFYNTFIRLAQKEIGELLNFVTFRANELSPMEKANVRRFLFEASSIIVLTILSSLLAQWYDDETDDETRKRIAYPLYLAFRMRSEISFFLNPADTIRIMGNPTIGYSYITKVLRFSSQVLTDPFEEYQKNYGMHSKGDSKTMAYMLALFGINGYTTNPDVAYNNLKRYTIGS